jgi:hypothetical protein
MFLRFDTLFCDSFELTPIDICWRVVAFRMKDAGETRRIKKDTFVTRQSQECSDIIPR